MFAITIIVPRLETITPETAKILLKIEFELTSDESYPGSPPVKVAP
jgi:hypothetical protein